MNPLTAEWVAKAEADYAGAVALNRRRKQPLPDLVCFHCQQAAEKFIKAFLQEAGSPFPKRTS
jgi:HEPN domain-containing protein